jgi:hypothetical protein
MSDRRRLMDMPRDHLIHVVPQLRISGVLSMLCDSVQVLTGYRHTLVHATPVTAPLDEIITLLQFYGFDVLQTDTITPAQINELQGSGMIVYGTQGANMTGLGRMLPSIYYAYGNYDPKIEPDIVVPCSPYAARVAYDGTPLKLDERDAIMPFVDSRGYRQMAGAPALFTVGIFSSNEHEKYPYNLVRTLVKRWPDNMRLLVTTPPIVDPELKADLTRLGSRVVLCSPRPIGALLYTVQIDVLIHATAPGYHDPYGRTAVEALALGKAVLCERRGHLSEVLTDKINTVMYDTPDEALELVKWLHAHDSARTQLAASGQMWASWQDLSTATLKLQRTLRYIGA